MKRIYSIAVIAFVALLFHSCSKDFITRTPADSIDNDEAITDEASMNAALNGIYSSLRSVALFGRDLSVIGDVQADNSFVETRNSGRYLTQYRYTVTLADAVPTEIWATAYTTILRANRIVDANVTGGNAPSLKATAQALRALMYFKLVNVFARPYTADTSAPGVPIVLHYDPYALPARSSVGAVYKQIISDLEAGFANGQDYSASIYLSKYAIEGMLAKAYLYMNDMQNAQAAAIDVIENGPFSLLTPATYEAYWQNPAPRADALETLLEIDANVITNNGFDDLGGIFINGYQDIYASSQLYALYGDEDIRKSVLVEGETKSGAAAVLNAKYPNAQNTDRDNPRVMRLSEVYLIAAEASARLGDEATALQYLNALVEQRDASLVYASSGDELISDIITERRKELAFEGDRLYDLNRLQLPVNRVSNAGAISTQALSIPYTDNRRISPIPQDETQSNPNLANEQNPGY